MGRSTSASVACVSDQMPFPHRSPRRSSANAAWGGLKPPTAGRLRRANLHLLHSTMSSLKGRGFVKTLVTWDCAGFRPPCRRHPVRAGVKTERPQPKRGRTVLTPGRAGPGRAGLPGPMHAYPVDAQEDQLCGCVVVGLLQGGRLGWLVASSVAIAASNVRSTPTEGSCFSLRAARCCSTGCPPPPAPPRTSTDSSAVIWTRFF
jgi:hypothetical protein